jgi:hypothetical protein
VGAAAGAIIGGFIAPYWREATMMSPETPLGVFLGGLAGFSITWVIAFAIKFVKAPADLYYAENARANALQSKLDHIENKRTDFVIGIDGANFIDLEEDKNATLIILSVFIENKSNDPSVAKNWTLKLVSKNGDESATIYRRLGSHESIPLPGAPPLVGSDTIDLKTENSPVIGLVRGRVAFQLFGVPYLRNPDPDTTFNLSVRDKNDKVHFASLKLKELGSVKHVSG